MGQDYHRLLSLGEAGSKIWEDHLLWIPFIPYLSGCVVGQDYHQLLSLGEAGSEISEEHVSWIPFIPYLSGGVVGRITTGSSVSERQEARFGRARFVDPLYNLSVWLCCEAGLPSAPQSRRGRKRDSGGARFMDSLYTLSEWWCCGAG